ncbi:uncharacterized protein E0L32_004115 [Thyridium curvatum]|uniref:Carboxylic ester hydrolase n=1 Tax=Thyridium curvatum TaxID=1093900 RepID=A0A507BHT1_9PEZI|nr:uncharacterized protein E0L32_004115 [Thyridium curvatum]TPX16120.1 hypothetical protein E0L32_004115 [Thyridium curvatum]
MTAEWMPLGSQNGTRSPRPEVTLRTGKRGGQLLRHEHHGEEVRRHGRTKGRDVAVDDNPLRNRQRWYRLQNITATQKLFAMGLVLPLLWIFWALAVNQAEAWRPFWKSHHAKCVAATFDHVLPVGATIERIDHVLAGDTYGEGAADIAYPTQPTDLPELCAVTVKVPSSSSTSFRFGLFLPMPPHWKAKFLAVGNGGFAGGINWLDMAPGAHYGMAALSTDTGHNSTTMDIAWALNQPEKKTDWGWRALHRSVELGKKMTEAYYARRIKYSYYNGCSTGGRQGLKEVQISPDSFDGALIGAPSWYPAHINPFVNKFGMYNLPVDDPKHLSTGDFSMLAKEVQKQCDEADGVKDNIVSAPWLCAFDFRKIQCGQPGVNASACLTDLQIQTAKNVYKNDYSPGGEVVNTGLDFSSEEQWYILLGGTEPSKYGTSYVKYFVYDDPDWDWHTYNDSVLEYAARTDPGQASAIQFDLSKFRRRGGKIILHHGLADGLVPPRGSMWYYNKTVQTMGKIDDFFTFFQIPGMQHCGGTPSETNAPWNMGGAFQAGSMSPSGWSVPGFKDSKHDALLALMDWVEKGKPAKSVIATTYNSPTNSSTGVYRQRPICAYPKSAKWDGKGDQNKASSWACK